MLRRASIKIKDENEFVQILPETVTDQVLDPTSGEPLHEILEKMQDTASQHISERINSEQGVHGMRFFNRQLSVKIDDNWVAIFSLDT